MSERKLLRKLRALNGGGNAAMGMYLGQQPQPLDPREALEEALEYRRTILAEELLKIATESWGGPGHEKDSLVAMAMSCKEAAGVIYPELVPEELHGSNPAAGPERVAGGRVLAEAKDQGGDQTIPLPTREGMLSMGGPGFVAAHEREQPYWTGADDLEAPGQRPSEYEESQIAYGPAYKQGEDR